MNFRNGFPIGYVSKSHGFKGHVKLNFFEEEYKKLISKEGFLFLEIDNKGVPFFIEEIESTGTIVKLEDVDSEEIARRYCKLQILSFSDSLEKVAHDLIGFTVMNSQGTTIGVITEVQDLNGNTVLSVVSNHNDLMVPFHEDLLIDIDAKAKLMTLEIPEGLLDL